MKKIFALIVVCFVVASSFAKDYKHSIGLVGGSGIGIQYKTMVTNHFTIIDEFGYLGCYAAAGDGFTVGYMGAIDQAVFAYQAKGVEGQGIKLDWYIGGQLKAGYINLGGDAGLIGVGGAVGLEGNMSNAPIAFSFDFRPGYACGLFGGQSFHMFDWTFNLGVRYTF